MLCKGISTVTQVSGMNSIYLTQRCFFYHIVILLQFTVVIFWLSAITNGKSSNSSTVTNETKENLLSLPFLDDSKIFRYDKWKFHWPRKIVSSTNEILVTKRNRSGKENSVSSVSGL